VSEPDGGTGDQEQIMIINVLSAAVATLASFLLSSIWYAGLGRALARLSTAYGENATMSPVKVLLELLRSAVLATVVTVLVRWAGVDNVGFAVGFALIAWIGFPVVLLSGSVLHERVPWRLAAIHAGDWLIKLIAVTLIVGLWR
jgi:hypothetical protein